MGIEPKDAADTVCAGETAERADRDRVVAAEHERLKPFVDRPRDEVRDALAGLLDRREEAHALAAHLGRLRYRSLDVAPVIDVPTQAFDPRVEARVPDRGRPHVDPSPAGAEVEARADQGNGPCIRLHGHEPEITFA